MELIGIHNHTISGVLYSIYIINGIHLENSIREVEGTSIVWETK